MARDTIMISNYTLKHTGIFKKKKIFQEGGYSLSVSYAGFFVQYKFKSKLYPLSFWQDYNGDLMFLYLDLFLNLLSENLKDTAI